MPPIYPGKLKLYHIQILWVDKVEEDRVFVGYEFLEVIAMQIGTIVGTTITQTETEAKPGRREFQV